MNCWTPTKDFFLRLDYPKDEAEALRVARLFVKCFADWKDPSPL